MSRHTEAGDWGPFCSESIKQFRVTVHTQKNGYEKNKMQTREGEGAIWLIEHKNLRTNDIKEPVISTL